MESSTGLPRIPLLSEHQKRIVNKNVLVTGGSIRSAHFCVKNIFTQDVGFVVDGHVEGAMRQHAFKKICSLWVFLSATQAFILDFRQSGRGSPWP